MTKQIFPSYLDKLSDVQREAVEYCSGPALVVAGAGSGKTRVLVAKMMHLIKLGYQPWTIMALTFTNKAAREMKSRIASELDGVKFRDLRVGTFHSVFLRIIRRFSDKLGFNRDFTIYDTSEQKSLIKKIIKDLSLDDKKYTPKICLSNISNAKNRLVSVEDYRNSDTLKKADKRNRLESLVDVYTAYQQRLFESNALDFDDILYYSNILLRDFEDVRQTLRNEVKYLLIDEYQDTNFSQYVLIQQLMGPQGLVFAVGDDAQSIYGFRGANLDNILKFEEAYPSTKIFKLEENYRSTKNIVNVANRLIQNNIRQIKKEVFSSRDKGEKVFVKECFSEIKEAEYLAQQVSEAHNRKHYSYRDIAILYRTNAQSRLLEQELRKRAIPFKIQGGMSFFAIKEIKDVMAYLKLINNPNDSEAIMRTINQPKRGIGSTSQERIMLLARERGYALSDIIADEKLLSQAGLNKGATKNVLQYNELLEALRTLDQNDLKSIVTKTIKLTGLYDFYCQGNDTESISQKENINELINGITQYEINQQENGEDAGLSDFLTDMSLVTDQDAENDKDQDYVSLMTVHAAKGLEYPMVMIAGLEEELFPSAYSKSEKDLEEERRLFYVAITRAKEECIITHATSRYQAGYRTSSVESRFLKEIEGDGCEREKGYISDFSNDPDVERFQRKNHESFDRPSWQLQEARNYDRAPKYQDRYEATATKKNCRRLRKIDKTLDNPIYDNVDYGVYPGNRVKHPKFGFGTVIIVEGEGANKSATVEFETIGTKKLLLRFAKLLRLD